MSVFLDTSGIFAMVDRDDPRNEAAVGAFLRLESAVTTNYVLSETIALIDRRLGRATLRGFIRDLREAVETVWVDEPIHDAAVAELTRARTKTSFVDLVSFEAMRRNGIETALAFDPDFKKAGFETIP